MRSQKHIISANDRFHFSALRQLLQGAFDGAIEILDVIPNTNKLETPLLNDAHQSILIEKGYTIETADLPVTILPQLEF